MFTWGWIVLTRVRKLVEFADRRDKANEDTSGTNDRMNERTNEPANRRTTRMTEMRVTIEKERNLGTVKGREKNDRRAIRWKEKRREGRERERVVRGRRSGSTGGFGAAWRARGGNSTRGGGLEWFSCSGTAAQVARVSPFSRRSRSRVGVRACIIRSVLLAPLLASRRSLPRGVIRGFSWHVPLVTRVCRVTSDQARGSSTRALRTSSVQSSLSPNRNHRHFDGDAEFFKCDLITRWIVRDLVELTQSTKRNRG